MKRRTRTIIGLFLIFSAVAMMVFWETEGREQLGTIPILVAARDMQPGELVEKNMLTERRASEEDRVKGVLKPEDADRILGRRILHLIPENSQIIEGSFGNPRHYIEASQGIFLIRQEWIFSVSSSLRKGDRVRIYGLDGTTDLGEFQVAFVKDPQGKEVIAGEEARKEESAILDRTHATGTVDQLEILAEIDEYTKILDYLFSQINPEESFSGYSEITSRKLIIRQEEEKKEGETR